MKVQYKVKITMLGLLVSGILSSCAKNDFLPQTPIFGLGGESWPKTSTDDYIYQNFIVPYNIQVKYRWDPYEVNFAKTLTPVMPEKVIPASYFKQIADLFVLQDLNIWGNFDETANNLTLHEDKQPTDECLVNKAILNTLQNGGSVYILSKERMPNGATIAASLRF